MTLPSSSLSFSPAFSPTDALLGAASSVQANKTALATSNVFGNNLFNTGSVNNLLNTGQSDSQALLQSLIGFVGTNAPTIGTSLGSQNVNALNLGNSATGSKTTLGDTFGLSSSSLPLPAPTTSTSGLNNIPTNSAQSASQGSHILVDPVTGFTFVQTPQSLRTSNGQAQRTNNNFLTQFMNILPIAALFSSMMSQPAAPATTAPAARATVPVATVGATPTKPTITNAG